MKWSGGRKIYKRQSRYPVPWGNHGLVEESSEYFLGLVDGMLIIRSILDRGLKGADTMEELERKVRGEIALTLSTLTDRRTEALLQAFEA